MTENSSLAAEARDVEWAYFAIEPLGTSVAPLLTYGFRLGMPLTASGSFELAYSQGGAGLYIASMRTKTWSARWHEAIGRGFYLSGGLAHRQLEGRVAIDPVLGFERLSAWRRVEHLVFDGAIGHRWHGQRYFVGVDWLGIMWPIHQLSSTRAIGGRKEELEVTEAGIDRFSAWPSAQALRLYVGVFL